MKTVVFVLVAAWLLIVIVTTSYVFVSAKSFAYQLSQMDRDDRDRAIMLQLRQIGLPYSFLNEQQVEYMLDSYYKERRDTLTPFDNMIFRITHYPMWRPLTLLFSVLITGILFYTYLREGWEIDKSKEGKVLE